MRFREKLARFMYGRNGIDRLGIALLVASMLLSLVNIFFRSYVYYIISLVRSVFLLLFILRALSKNLYKRQREDQVFVRIWGKVTGFFKLQKNRIRDRKTHIYRVCPHCKAQLRLPRRKGKHTVKCPKCNYRFDIKC